MEAICFSDMSVDFHGTMGVISQKIKLFENSLVFISENSDRKQRNRK
jgi:hypothetical protein